MIDGKRLLMTSHLMRLTIAICLTSGVTVASASDVFPQPPNTEKSSDRPMTAEEVCATAKLPPGFNLSVFAAEPNVQNPIAITTDERGRLWVAENYTWAGADAGSFDTFLKDRVIVLEDTDGDGKYDKRTVFYDQAKRLTSVQVGFGGIWLLCSPQVLFIPDRNRDDVPDGPPEVVLDGFDTKSVTHTVANGLKWGPDGWLYGRQGILGTSKIGVPGADKNHRITINTGVWRYHPTRHVCEAVMHGMTNPWGFDYDEFGEMFVVNTVIGHLWHVIPGAHNERMFGSDFDPHAYQLMPQVADHVHWDAGESWDQVRKGVTDRTGAAGGGHAHTGLLIYQGDNWPADYRGKAFMLNFHGRRINSDVLVRDSVGYTARHGRDMCFLSDPWFRGMDLISGPDGGVFIADWSDTGECHEIGGVHRTSGRIYELTYGKVGGTSQVKLANASDVQLALMQVHQNDWYTRHARRLLQERAATHLLDTVAVRKALLAIFQNNESPAVRLKAMWGLYLSQSVDEGWLLAQLKHPDEHIRVWAIRLLTDAHGTNDLAGWSPVLKRFETLANEDRSGLALLYLASALQKLPNEMRWTLCRVIARRSEVSMNKDRRLAIMLWLGIEPFVAQQPGRSIDLLTNTTFPLLRENIARRLTFEIDHDRSTVKKLLSLATNEPKVTTDILRGVAAALNGRTNVPAPMNWSEVSSKIGASSDEETLDHLNAIGIAFADPRTLASLRSAAEDTGSPPERRNRAIQLLLVAHPKNLNELLRQLVKDHRFALEAVQGLANYDDPDAPAVILDNYQGFSPELRTAAINTLVCRVKYAQVLVQALEAKRLAPSDISAFQARQIIALGDKSTNEKLRSLWGDADRHPKKSAGRFRISNQC